MTDEERTNEERTNELIQKAKESYKIYNELIQKAKKSYKIYSENKCVDAYEGYQYIDGYCNGYEQGYEDCRHYAHDYYKPKWHDLRKNPNDLPENGEEVLLYVKLNDKWKRNKVVLIGYRDYGDCLGEYCEDWGYVEPIRSCKYDFVDGEEVIAWCELPKFKE